MSQDCGSQEGLNRKLPLPPMKLDGVIRYRGILTVNDFNEVVVKGDLPKGETTQNITYWVVDRGSNAIVSQVVLPDRSNQFSGVEIRLKVARSSAGYQIGTFGPNGSFEPVRFLAVRSSPNLSSSSGPVGQT